MGASPAKFLRLLTDCIIKGKKTGKTLSLISVFTRFASAADAV